MASNLTFQTIVSGVLTSSGTKTNTDDGAEIAAPASVLAAQAGTLTTRVSNTAGTLTMSSASHGIITGQRIDLYWTGGSCFGIRAGTVSETSIPFTVVQGGSALPAAGTAIVAGICYRVPFEFTGDNITGLACARATALVRCYYVFLETLSILALAVLNEAGRMYVWDGTTKATGPIGSGPTGSASISAVTLNPLANTFPVEVWVSHADTAAADTGLAAAVLKH